jgi:DNA ligase-associated metallophosphoesterase
MTDGTVSLLVDDETLILHPQRAVLWPLRGTVIVADTHFGKSSHFARHGIAVPAGSDESDRERLSQLLRTARADRLIVLGDFLHAALEPGSRESSDLEQWVAELSASVEMHVVAGNHDRGTSSSTWTGLRWWEREFVDPPFRFIHDVQRARQSNAAPLFSLSGHVHPVVRLRELGKRSMRVPVFWRRAADLILPSFGVFTGGFAVSPQQGERMFAVGPSGVVPLG